MSEIDANVSNQRNPVQDVLPQFKKEERRELRYTLSVAIAMAMSWTFWLVPRTIRWFIADRLGDLFFHISSTYSQNVRENVETVETYIGSNHEHASERVRNIFRMSARNFMDLITMPRVSDNAFRRSAKLSHGSWDILDDALAAGSGGILVSGHLGCFDYIGQTLASRGYPMTVVTGRTTSRFIFDGVTWLRGAKGMTMVEPTPSGIRSVMKALRRNEFAVFVADRDFFQNGLDVEFMGKATTLPPGPVRIARQTGAPVIPIFTRRVERGNEIAILEPFRVERTHEQAADLASGMAVLKARLEESITACIDQWVMFHQVWPDRTRVPVRVFPVGSPLESELLEKVASAFPELESRGSRSTRQSSGDSADPPIDS